MTLPRAQFNSLIEQNPRVARAAIAFLCQRLRETSEQSEAIALHPIEVRLARFFLSKCNRGETRNGSAVATFELGMSQNELALLVGASRQKVNAALALLEKAGAVKRAGPKFTCTLARLQTIGGAA
jgi:CRP-like cAMP-binding protein